MYAPTYRSAKKADGTAEELLLNALDANAFLLALKEKFGGGWIFVFRAHYFSKLPQSTAQELNAIDASDYDDVQELVCASSALLTDYSSLMYDFALCKKPVFLLQSDLETYTCQERDFYMPPQKWPFPMAQSAGALEKSVREVNTQEYTKNVNSYLATVGSKDDGGASERTVLFLKQLLEKKYEER